MGEDRARRDPRSRRRIWVTSRARHDVTTLKIGRSLCGPFSYIPLSLSTLDTLSTMLSLAARTTLRAARPCAAPAAVRFVGGHGSTMHDNDPELLEREKAKNLAGHEHETGIHNAPGWNDRLASSSEAAIKVPPMRPRTPCARLIIRRRTARMSTRRRYRRIPSRPCARATPRTPRPSRTRRARRP